MTMMTTTTMMMIMTTKTTKRASEPDKRTNRRTLRYHNNGGSRYQPTPDVCSPVKRICLFFYRQKKNPPCSHNTFPSYCFTVQLRITSIGAQSLFISRFVFHFILFVVVTYVFPFKIMLTLDQKAAMLLRSEQSIPSDHVKMQKQTVCLVFR